MVITSFPIKLVSHRPEVSVRLAKWVAELGEHDVVFRTTTAVKSQILADFVAKISPTLPPALEQEIHLQNKEKEERILRVDGSCDIRGVGAGIIPTSPTNNTALRTIRYDSKETCRKWGIELTLAVSKSPQSHGQGEPTNTNMVDLLKKRPKISRRN